MKFDSMTLDHFRHCMNLAGMPKLGGLLGSVFKIHLIKKWYAGKTDSMMPV